LAVAPGIAFNRWGLTPIQALAMATAPQPYLMLLVFALACLLPGARGLRLTAAEDPCAERSHWRAPPVQAALVEDVADEQYIDAVEMARPRAAPPVSGRGHCDLAPGRKYLMILEAWEQWGGSRQVVADALVIAKTLGWTYVEPVTKDGRVVDPFTNKSWVPLRNMLDVDLMKTYYSDWIGIDNFLQRCNGSSVPEMTVIDHPNVAPGDWTFDELRAAKTQIVAMNRFRRKAREPFTSLFLSFRSIDGVPLRPSPWVAKTAARIMEKMDPRMEADGYICAQWRTEGAARTPESLHSCADAFEAAVNDTMQCHFWNGRTPKVVLLSDVRDETSDTMMRDFGKYQGTREAIDQQLDAALHHHRVDWALAAVRDWGQRALVEQHICARSRILVGCPHGSPGRHCPRCSRVQSKFAGLIYAMRAELNLNEPVLW